MVTPDKSAAAVDAFVRYAQEVARLPSFPKEPWLELVEEMDKTVVQTAPTLLKPVTIDAIPGDVLPPPQDVWLALLPFHDLHKTVKEPRKRDLIQKRRAILSILTTLAFASESPVQWKPLAIPCGESTGPDPKHHTFWIELLHTLCPDAARDTTKALTKHLIVMTQTRSLRFLLCIANDVSSGDVLDLLQQFLHNNENQDKLVEAVLRACGMTGEGLTRRTIEIGLSFSRGKFSHAVLTRLLDLMEQKRPNIRVTTLRFGQDCTFQPKALEMLTQRPIRASIQHIRLGSLFGLKPACVRMGFYGFLSAERGLERLGMTSFDGFKAVASMLRNEDTQIQHLDVAYEPTIENAVWLAFGLFHVDSNSRVSSLHLHLPNTTKHDRERTDMMTREWLDAFKRVLQSTTADRDLADMEDDSETQEEEEKTERKFVTIKNGTPVKAGLYGGAKLLCKIDALPKEFEMIAEAENSIAVLIPGIGSGWVPASSVTSERIVASRLSSRSSDAFPTNERIKTLIWDGPISKCHKRSYLFGTHVDVLFGLLAIIGKSLKHLHLPAMKIRTDQLALILQHCPNLLELNITGNRLTSLTPLVDGYANGTCKITTLWLGHTATNWSDYTTTREGTTFRHGQISTATTDMITILGGPKPIIKRLTFDIFQPFLSGLTREQQINQFVTLMKAFGDASELAYLQLPGSAYVEEELSRPTAWVFNERGESTPVSPTIDMSVDLSIHPHAFAPISLANKLAFLSCLHREQATSAQSRLDARVLSLIFQFSHETIARRVLLDAPVALERCACCYGEMVGGIATSDEFPRQAW